MAQHRVAIQVPVTFIDKRKASAGSATTGVTSGVATPANYATLAAMDTRLAAISGTTFTQARLDTMTMNDKVYALHVIDDAATL
jgi:hypothetical protein